MIKNKKRRSLRATVLIAMGLCLLLFTAANLAAYLATMPRMISEAEQNYLSKWVHTIEEYLRSAEENTYRMAEDIAIWDETDAFIRGENPDFISSNWPDQSPLEAYGFDFLIIKDAQGNDLYQEFFDTNAKREMPVPAGFGQRLKPLAQKAMDRYADGPPTGTTDIRDFGVGGILCYDGVYYAMATMPVMLSRETGTPSGTVTIGNILSDAYFQRATYSDTTYVDIIFSAEETHEQPAEGTAVINSVYFSDIDGNPVLFRIREDRLIYETGRQTLFLILSINVAMILLFGGILYIVSTRFVFRPIERLTGDIEKLSSTQNLDVAAHSSNREFVSLSDSINGMLARLKESNLSLNTLQSILRSIDCNIYVTDPDTDELLFINDRMKETFHIPDDAIGRPCWKILQRGQTQRCEFCAMHTLSVNPSEVLLWEEREPSTGRVYQNTDCLIEWVGRKRAHLQYNIDITEKREAELNMKRRMEQQELMSLISSSFVAGGELSAVILEALRMTGEFLDVSKIVIPAIDDDGRTVHLRYDWNNEKQNIPYTPPIRKRPFDAGNPFYTAFIEQKLPYITRGDVTKDPGLAYMVKFGVKSMMAVPLYTKGELWGFIVLDDCIATRVWTTSDIQLVILIANVIAGAIERELNRQKLMRMSAIASGSPQFISYITSKGRFEYCNPGTERVLGYRPEVLEAGDISMILDEEALARMRKDVIPRIVNEGSLDFEIPLKHVDGTYRLMSVSSFTTDTQPVGIGAIAVDITEKKRLEKDLIAAKEQAEASSRAKGDFLSRMSHEMRTPMGAIIGMTAIAKSSPDVSRKEYCLERIEGASRHLLGVINDILDMSKIEADKLELSYTDFNLEKMLMRVVDVTNFRITEKNQNLIVRIDPSLPASIICDEQRLAQVITNFLSNATKFTPEEGTITIEANAVSPSAGGLTALEIIITDTGIGITEEQQSRLFRSFEQADGGISRKYGGTGLGLAISKRIIELMGGNVWVESEAGKGARFALRIEVEPGKERGESLVGNDIRWSSLRALVVDDSKDVLDYFHSIADSVGLHLESAQSSREGLRILQEKPAGYFHILFVDWRMPDMDGIELTRQIKERYGSESVVIMISAAEWSDVESEARRVGVDRFLPKPLFASSIVNSINECLGVGKCLEEPGYALTDTYAGKRILLAEDIEINREIVISLLEDTGVEIDTAENGSEACALFEKDPSRYDLIFMDIHMPEVDGYEATRRIRAMNTARAKTVPIVAMTANVFREDVERCRNAGMDDHIGKPIDMTDLFTKLRKYMNLHRGE